MDDGDSQSFVQSILYLSKNPLAVRIIQDLEKSPVTYHIRADLNLKCGKLIEEDYDHQTATIRWNPHCALKCGNALQSPAMVLFHELTHAWLDEAGARGGLLSIPFGSYTNLLEYVIIEGFEGPVAEQLGEGNRHSHDQPGVPVPSPTAH